MSRVIRNHRRLPKRSANLPAIIPPKKAPMKVIESRRLTPNEESPNACCTGAIVNDIVLKS